MVRKLVKAGTLTRLHGKVIEAIVESPNTNADYWRGRVSIDEIALATGFTKRHVQRALNGGSPSRPLRALLSDQSDSLRILHRDGFGVNQSFRYEVPKYTVDVGKLRALLLDVEAPIEDHARGVTVTPKKREENSADRTAELWSVAEAGMQLEAEQRYRGDCRLSDLARNDWRQRNGRPVAIAADRSRRFGADKVGRDPAEILGRTVAPQPTAAELAVVSGARDPITDTHRPKRELWSARDSVRPEVVA